MIHQVVNECKEVINRNGVLSLADFKSLISRAYHLAGGELTDEVTGTLLYLCGAYSSQMDSEAQKLAERFKEAAFQDDPHLRGWFNQQFGTDGQPASYEPRIEREHCWTCAGSGWITCSSCIGYGYHSQTTTRTDFEGNVEYVEEQIPCMCSGGQMVCTRCSGAGYV